MIIEEPVEINITNRNVNYYRNLGYDLPKDIIPCKIQVKSTELPYTSPIKIHVVCEYCGEIFISTPRLVYEMKKAYTSKCACKKCQGAKLKDTIKSKYGVNSLMDVPEFVEKQKATNLEKYGVTNPFDSKEIQNKIKHTIKEKYGVEWAGQIETNNEKIRQLSLKKYGTTHPTKSKQVQEKKIKTVQERYGVDHVSQLEEVKKKASKSMMERYGVEHYSQLPEMRQKLSESFVSHMEPPSSLCQDHICELVGGHLNYRCHGFFLDVLYENWLDIEYNGTGHNLIVQLGKMTQEEFDKKEKQRKAAIFGYGYKMLILVLSKSKRDKLPEDSVLLEFLQKGINKLRTEGINELTMDLDTLTIIA